jgi:hypothetical protein
LHGGKIWVESVEGTPKNSEKIHEHRGYQGGLKFQIWRLNWKPFGRSCNLQIFFTYLITENRHLRFWQENRLSILDVMPYQWPKIDAKELGRFAGNWRPRFCHLPPVWPAKDFEQPTRTSSFVGYSSTNIYRGRGYMMVICGIGPRRPCSS